MYNVSQFMKTLKQQVTQSYNRRHGRKGTLWEERFKSLLVQGRMGTLGAVASYIDLNAVRAGVVRADIHVRQDGDTQRVSITVADGKKIPHLAIRRGVGAEWNRHADVAAMK